ncbi:MAG: hypothetical protein ACXADL_02830 [Candidatus Thorarchaeota archaeon]
MSSIPPAVDLVIRFESGNINFPGYCPVCGDPATTDGTIARSKTNRLKTKGPYYHYTWGRRFLVRGETRQLRIPVCERHYFSFEDVKRAGTILGIVAGVSALLFMSLTIIIAFNLYDGNTLPILGYVGYAIVTFIMLGSFRALRPRKLEKAISIMDFNVQGQSILLRIRDTRYGEEMLRLNSSNARPIGYKRRNRF